MRLRVTEFLRETKIDNVDLIATLADAHQEVVRLYVTVYEVARVDVLDSGDLWRYSDTSVDITVAAENYTHKLVGKK